MQKQKRNGIYVLLLLLAMVGIGGFMVEEEMQWQQIYVIRNTQGFCALLNGVGEYGSDEMLLNGPVLNEEGADGQVIAEGTENASNGANMALEGYLETMEPPFVVGATDAAYFDDALFIGDSRTVGIEEYGYFEQADFFADVSMSVYKVWNRKIAVTGKTKQKLEDILAQNSYGKVYVMLGINELGYDYEQNVKKYTELIEAIRVAQPEAVIYICANLHVTEKQSEADKYFNNDNINRFNQAIEALADGESCFYIDINPMFDDENGNLSTDYSSDEAHVKAQYYVAWCDWLMTQAIVKTK
ncbi:MAG: hypothetical protein J6A73_05200 [Lachnospiraceae bacterium]|nr:hypothetical protein [Lachnospiraceae bacterium]